MARTTALVAGALILLGWAAFAWRAQHAPHVHELDGFTMGSTWSVRVVGPRRLDVDAVRDGVESQLAELDRQLSGYRDVAELAQFNRTPVGEWRVLPAHLREVVVFGRRLHADSGGAFDITIKPLVNLWGFGSAEPRLELPNEQEIANARSRLGTDYIELSANGARMRRVADVTLDVDAIAPGYAADIIAAWLTARGLADHLVDIGGELRVDGHKPGGGAWRVGIERPVMARGDVEETIAVANVGVSTSGDYRDYFEVGGRRYSHIIDPATGRPVEHGLTSVTVVARSALAADGYATTLMVLGPERGMAWADALGLAVFMIVKDKNGALQEQYNAAFELLLVAR
jgi:thiamine biosynthesis lipoprotein